MGWKDLPTLAEVQAQRRTAAQLAKPGKFERVREKDKADAVDKKKLSAWSKEVRERDEWRDRFDGKKVIKTANIHPRRAEAHHIVGRSDEAVRYDVRNGITLAMETHEKVENGELIIVGTKFFTVDGKRYIDAKHPVKFRGHK